VECGKREEKKGSGSGDALNNTTSDYYNKHLGASGQEEEKKEKTRVVTEKQVAHWTSILVGGEVASYTIRGITTTTI